MSSDGAVAVAAHGVGKKYKIYNTPFARIKEGLSFGKRSYHKEVWALRGVDFQVKKGSALGIVGSNGAGKSTLLKILSGTTMPSEGNFEISGKVASLLELGTGFHSEFTGRDNIFLNAAVMGFSKRETTAKLDSIIEFTELGHFIDQPVRTYSSGMIMRLGFSVATAIDPEVLIIDEILAVGDMHFQKKCIDRIFDFRARGKTIIFCSHSMYDVRQICDDVIWIKQGKVERHGPPLEITAEYSNYERSLIHDKNVLRGGAEMANVENPPKIERVELIDTGGQLASVVKTGSRLRVRVRYRVPETWNRVINVGFAIWRSDNVLIAAASSGHDRVKVPCVPGKTHEAFIEIPQLDLLDGEFSVNGYIYDESGLHIYDHLLYDRPLVIAPEPGAVGVIKLNHSWSFHDP